MAAEGLIAMRIEIVPIERDLLGEAPVWDDRIGTLYWADQLGRKVRAYDPVSGGVRDWAMPDVVGCVVPTDDIGKLLVAQPERYVLLDLATGGVETFVTIAQPRPGVRLNDGRCDRAGRLIGGSVTTDGGEAAGRIWRVSGDGRIELLRENMVIVNAICCNAAGDAIYYADSREGLVYTRQCDPQSGALSKETVFADVRPHGGVPDGATVDAAGGVWIAQIMRGHILRFAPDGTLDRDIEMPCPHVSSLAFGGADLETLYVTSVRETGMLISSDHPGAGGLFAIHDLGVRGIAEGRFALPSQARATQTNTGDIRQ